MQACDPTHDGASVVDPLPYRCIYAKNVSGTRRSALFPEYAVVFGRDNQKNRFLAKVANQNNVLEEMLKCEPIGKNGTVVYDTATELNRL